MLQAAQCDSLLFDSFSSEQGCFAATEVDVGQGQDPQAFVVAAAIVVIKEGGKRGVPGNGLGRAHDGIMCISHPPLRASITQLEL